MSTISVTNIADGDAVTAASINNQVNTIVNDYNGNITAANLASSSVTTAKITNSTVTADKLSTGATQTLIATSESTASTSYTDLATVGPSVTVTIGVNGLALLTITVQQSNSAGTAVTYTSYVASGANTIAASDNTALVFVSPANNNALQASYTALLTGLTAGSTTFKMQYRCNGSIGSWLNRRLAVIPL